MGHSVGARAAATACQTDSRIRLNEGALDRGFPFWADAQGRSMKQPFLMVSRPVVFPESPTEEELAKLRMTREQFHATVADILRFWQSIEGGASWVQIKSDTFQHNSFADSSVLAPKDPAKSRSARVDLDLIRVYVREFFDHHLKNEQRRHLILSNSSLNVEEFTSANAATKQ